MMPFSNVCPEWLNQGNHEDANPVQRIMRVT
jgi:hypothetical protein